MEIIVMWCMRERTKSMLTEFKVDLKMATSTKLNLPSLVEVLTDDRRLRSILLLLTTCGSGSSRVFAEHDRYQTYFGA